MSSIKDQIRQEIERLYDGEAPKHDQQCEFEDGYFTGIATISKIIDSLPDENNPEPYNPVYDEDYLNGKIAKAKKSWEGVDVDKFMNEVRGRDEEPSKELEEEISRTYHDGSVTETDNIDHVSYENIARHFAEWGARHSINWGDVQLLDTFILELSREEKDGTDWGDSEKFYTEVLRRFHEFNDKKIPEIVAEWEAKHKDSLHVPETCKENQDSFTSLEEAAKEYAKDYEVGPNRIAIKAFIAGAKWQSKQLLKGSPLPEDTVLFQKGVEEGKRLLMEEAVEGYVAQRVHGELYAKAKVPESMNLEFGDKAKIIIIKDND